MESNSGTVEGAGKRRIRPPTVSVPSDITKPCSNLLPSQARPGHSTIVPGTEGEAISRENVTIELFDLNIVGVGNHNESKRSVEIDEEKNVQALQPPFQRQIIFDMRLVIVHDIILRNITQTKLCADDIHETPVAKIDKIDEIIACIKIWVIFITAISPECD